jgi:hypothetical protein
MDRDKFSYALNRETFLTAMGWKMMHFSFDDIQSRPEVCRMLLQMVVGPYMLRSGETISSRSASQMMEKEVLRLAWTLGRAIRPQDVIQQLDVDFRTARKWLRGLVEKGCLSPVATGSSIRSYELKEGSWEHL